MVTCTHWHIQIVDSSFINCSIFEIHLCLSGIYNAHTLQNLSIPIPNFCEVFDVIKIKLWIINSRFRKILSKALLRQVKTVCFAPKGLDWFSVWSKILSRSRHNFVKSGITQRQNIYTYINEFNQQLIWKWMWCDTSSSHNLCKRIHLNDFALIKQKAFYYRVSSKSFSGAFLIIFVQNTSDFVFANFQKRIDGNFHLPAHYLCVLVFLIIYFAVLIELSQKACLWGFSIMKKIFRVSFTFLWSIIIENNWKF